MKRVLSIILSVAIMMTVLGGIPFTVNAASMTDQVFFSKFNYDAYPAMADVKAAVDAGDFALAKTELLKYLAERKANGEASAFPIEDDDENYGQAVLPLDNILTGPYEFDIWLNRFTVTSREYALYEIDLTEKVGQELNNQAISVMLFEREKQAYPVLVASKEFSGYEPVLVVETVEGDTYEITANHDTFVHSGATTTTNGTAQELYVKEQSDSPSSPFGTQTRRAYINFPLVEAANKTVAKATMKLYAKMSDDCTLESLDVHVISVGDTMWDENRLTWATIGGNIYSYQNAEVPTWQQPGGADGEYQNVTTRFWFARSMAYEYITYLADPEAYAESHPLYPDGSVFGEKLIDLMDAFASQKSYGYNRTLETGERINRWVDVLDALIDTPAAQNNPDKICNIISFIWGDCNYLAGLDITNGSYWWSNWRIVANAGFFKGNEYFPEFNNYSAWRNKVVGNIEYTFDYLFMDDMSFGEAGPAYAVWCVELFGDCARMAELNGRPLEKSFTEKLRYATRFALESIYPDGYDTNIGDSNYKDRLSVFTDLNKFYGNDTIISAFVSANSGEGSNGAEGDNPSLYYSCVYHDSNTMMMRNSWNPDEAVYLQLNNNPFDGHAHPDSNGVVMYAYGKPLLVDSGRYSYSSFNTIYNDLRYASAHNTIEAVGVSMANHSGSARPLEYSVINDTFDFAATSQSGYPNTTHTRNVMFLKNGYSIVTDYIDGTANRTYRQNWHFMPSSNAVMEGNTAKTNFYNEANIIVANADSDNAAIRDGFHSADYGLVAASKYASFEKAGSKLKFDTVLYPVKADEATEVTVTDLAEGDNSKAALELLINGDTAHYYVQNTADADGAFGPFTTDAKMAYVGPDYWAIVDGTTISGEVESTKNIKSMSFVREGTTINITGECIAACDKSEAMAISAPEVLSVTLNGEEIPFEYENGMLYAVKSTDVKGDISYDGSEYNIVGENLITNGDFSNGTTDWTDAATGAQYKGTVSGNNGHGTSKSLTNTAQAGGSAASTLRRYIPVEAGKTYYLSYYAYATSATGSNGPMSAAVLTKGGEIFGNFNGLSYYNYNLYGGMNSWSSESSNEQIGGSIGRVDNSYSQGMNHKEFFYTVPEGAENLMISFFAWTAPGLISLSDFELYEIEKVIPEGMVETCIKVAIVDNNGEEIDSNVITGVAENEIYVYDAEKSFDKNDVHYVLNEELSDLSCKIAAGENVLTVTYDKVGLVTVKHVNESGSEITAAESVEAEIGTGFNGKDYAKNNVIFDSKVYNYVNNADDAIIVNENISANVIELLYEESDVAFDGTMAKFTFDDEDTGFVSEFAKAKASGTITLSDDAKRGKSLYLDGSGSNFLSVTNSEGDALLTGLDEVTIVFYAKVAGNGSNWSIFMSPDTNAQVYNAEKYVGMLHNGNLIVERYLNSGSRTPVINVADPIGEWKKYALVIEDDITTLYINGVATELASSYKLSDILGDNSVLQIGKANWGSGEYFNGYIDELAIYNYAMSADELVALGGESKVSVSYVDTNGTELLTSAETSVLAGVELTENIIPYDKHINVSGKDYVVKNIEGLGVVAEGDALAVKVVYTEAVLKELVFKAAKGDSLKSASNALNDFASETGGDYPARLMADNRSHVKRAGLAGFVVDVPENNIITKATVKLHINDSVSPEPVVIYSAESLPDDWSRGNVVNFELPAESIATGTISGGYATFDVSKHVANGTFNVALFTKGTNGSYIIYDSENTSYVPELIIETAIEKKDKFEVADGSVVYTSYDGVERTVAVAYISENGEVLKVVTNTGKTETVSVVLEEVAGAVCYRAYVWESISSMKPVTEPIVRYNLPKFVTLTNLKTVLSGETQALELSGVAGGEKVQFIVDPEQAVDEDLVVGDVILYDMKGGYAVNIRKVYDAGETVEDGVVSATIGNIPVNVLSDESVTVNSGVSSEYKGADRSFLLDGEKFYLTEDANVTLVEYTQNSIMVRECENSEISAESNCVKRTVVKTVFDNENLVSDVVVFAQYTK